MRCSRCRKKVSKRWSEKVNEERFCPACYRKNFVTFLFGSRKHLPLIEVVIDHLPPGQGPDHA